jgi:hypothetical protein
MHIPSSKRLFPFGAMNGCVGGSGADTGCTAAGEPMNLGRLAAPGPSGIGTGSTAKAASAPAANAIVATQAPMPRDSRRTRREYPGQPSANRARPALRPVAPVQVVCRHPLLGDDRRPQ